MFTVLALIPFPLPIPPTSVQNGASFWVIVGVLYGCAMILWAIAWGGGFAYDKQYPNNSSPPKFDAIMILLTPIWVAPALWFSWRALKVVIKEAFGGKGTK